MATLNLSEREMSIVYAALRICTPSGGGSNENTILMKMAQQAGNDVVNISSDHYERLSNTVLDEYFECMNLTRDEADERLKWGD